MDPRGQRVRDRRTQKGAVGFWFRLYYYAVLMVVCGILVGTLYLASLLD